MAPKAITQEASPGFALPADFWSGFHAEYWEKRATVLRQPFARLIAQPEDSFQRLIDVGDRYRAGETDLLVRFCVGYTQQLVDVARYLPMRTDASVAGYADRATRLVGGQRFGLVVEDFQAFDATLWLHLREFLRGLYEHTGMPRESAKATVFLGNYEHTPWGLHRGRSGTFQLVVAGPKRIRVWPDAFFRGKEDMTHRLDYEQYNGDSIVLDAEPGDVIYWPSDHWHVGESVGGALSFAISIALFIDQHSSPALLGYAEGPVERRLSPQDRDDPIDVRPERITESTTGVDRVVTRAIVALRDASEDERLELQLRVHWLNHITAYGFTRPPAPLERQRLADDAIIHTDPDYPVLWLRSANDELLCSANGHAFGITASPRIVALLERLNGGDSHGVGALIDDHSGVAVAGGVEFDTTRESVRALLEKLVSVRAVIVESDVTTRTSRPT